MNISSAKSDQIVIYKNLVVFFGGQLAAQKALGVAQSTISGWVNGDHFMSAVTAAKAERATNGEFKAVDLCPALKELEVSSH